MKPFLMTVILGKAIVNVSLKGQVTLDEYEHLHGHRSPIVDLYKPTSNILAGSNLDWTIAFNGAYEINISYSFLSHAASPRSSKADVGTTPPVASEIFRKVSVVVLSPLIMRYICIRLRPMRSENAVSVSPLCFRCMMRGCVSLLIPSCNASRDVKQEKNVTPSVTTT